MIGVARSPSAYSLSAVPGLPVLANIGCARLYCPFGPLDGREWILDLDLPS